jgi:hypothetical protein
MRPFEHAFRFFKYTLRWTAPTLRSPAAADRWAWLLILAYVQLRLARDAGADVRLPWQPPLPPEQRTPARVRHGFAQLLRTWATPRTRQHIVDTRPGVPKVNALCLPKLPGGQIDVLHRPLPAADTERLSMRRQTFRLSTTWCRLNCKLSTRSLPPD